MLSKFKNNGNLDVFVYKLMYMGGEGQNFGRRVSEIRMLGCVL